jgi:hypothetical protein
MDPKSIETSDDALSWLLVYTKARAESWADINLRNQGFATLLPRVLARGGFAPLFPRYVFVGHAAHARTEPIRGTAGVLYVVHFGERPARVPSDVIAEVSGRMNHNGVVILEVTPRPDSLFAKRQQERLRVLVQLAEAGFRVKTA